VSAEQLPGALLEAVRQQRPCETALKALELIGPMTSATAPGALVV
jgi:hypothetical protein